MGRKENHQESNRRDNQKKIIGALLGGGLAEEAENEIRDWLSGDEDREMIDEAIHEAAIEFYKGETTTDISTLRSLNHLKGRLDLPVHPYRVERGVVQIPPYKQEKAKSESGAPVIPRRRRMFLKVAAVLLPLIIAAGLVTIKQLRRAAPLFVHEISVPADSLLEITLPDRSTVVVKSNTSLTYYSNFLEERQVLLDGEAYFSVLSDPTHPFSVESGAMKVTVFGTEFNIKAFLDEPTCEVSLASGNLSVTSGGQTVVLKPNQKALVGRMSNEIILREAGAGELMRLRGETLSFDDLLLNEALRTTAGYFDKELVMEQGIKDDHFSMIPPDELSLIHILQSLSGASGEFDFTIEGDTIFVKKKM